MAPLAISLGMVGLSTTDLFFHLFDEVDERLYKGWTFIAYERAQPTDVLAFYESIGVILIDDESLRDLGLPWPLPRSLYATVGENLRAAGAKTLALDIVFSNPGVDPAQDQLLAQFLARPDVIVAGELGVDGDFLRLYPPHSTLVSEWTEEDVETRLGTVTAGPQKILNPQTGERKDAFEDHRYAVLRIVQEPTDVMGRSVGERQTFYAWDVLALAHFQGRSPEEVLSQAGGFSTPMKFGELSAEFHLGRINFLPPGINYQIRKAAPDDLREGEVRFVEGKERDENIHDFVNVFTLKEALAFPERIKERFGGKPFLALVGVGLTGTDVKHTPVGDLPGVEIHANILANLMHQRFLSPAPKRVGRLLLFLGCLLIGLVGVRLDARLGTVVMLLSGVALYFGARWAFLERHLLVPVALPVTGIGLTYVAASVLNYLHLKARLAGVTNMFQEVCPLHDLERLEKEGGIELGGVEKELTILFSDLRGYTSFAEKLDAVTVLNTLNEYFGAVGTILRKHGGCVFDYQGDAQMVVFGVLPASADNHAAAACRAAAEMSKALEELGRRWNLEGRELPDTGVGICTGPVSFGVLGTSHHKQYVAIGDPTNTAARIQGKSAELGHQVLLTESTVKAAGDLIASEYLDDLSLKGKRKELPVYRLVIEPQRESGD